MALYCLNSKTDLINTVIYLTKIVNYLILLILNVNTYLIEIVTYLIKNTQLFN